jgi:hypothetical protein
MRFRKLRIAWSVACGVICLLLILLWVRSYFRLDRIEWRFSRGIMSNSFRGQLGISWIKYRSALPAEFQGITFRSSPIVPGPNGTKVNYNDGSGRPLPSLLGFKSSWISAPVRRRVSTFVTPYWFPTLLSGIVASISLWRSSLRFSLRTMLIATTLVAVMLGIITIAM